MAGSRVLTDDPDRRNRTRVAKSAAFLAWNGKDCKALAGKLTHPLTSLRAACTSAKRSAHLVGVHLLKMLDLREDALSDAVPVEVAARKEAREDSGRGARRRGRSGRDAYARQDRLLHSCCSARKAHVDGVAVCAAVNTLRGATSCTSAAAGRLHAELAIYARADTHCTVCVLQIASGVRT